VETQQVLPGREQERIVLAVEEEALSFSTSIYTFSTHNTHTHTHTYWKTHKSKHTAAHVKEKYFNDFSTNLYAAYVFVKRVSAIFSLCYERKKERSKQAGFTFSLQKKDGGVIFAFAHLTQ